MDAQSELKLSSIAPGTRPLQLLENEVILHTSDIIDESEYPDSFHLSAILVSLVFSIFLVSLSPILMIINSISNAKL
jgi:hypothetical protein